MPGARRQIVSRGPRSVTMQETTRWLGVRVFWERVTAYVGERDVRFTGENQFAVFDGAYSFDEDEGGTRVSLAASIRLKPALRWSELAAKPVVLAILRVDLAGHVKDMRRDVKAA